MHGFKPHGHLAGVAVPEHVGQRLLQQAQQVEAAPCVEPAVLEADQLPATGDACCLQQPRAAMSKRRQALGEPIRIVHGRTLDQQAQVVVDVPQRRQRAAVHLAIPPAQGVDVSTQGHAQAIVQIAHQAHALVQARAFQFGLVLATQRLGQARRGRLHALMQLHIELLDQTDAADEMQRQHQGHAQQHEAGHSRKVVRVG
ncbi:hypothetical protein D9M72_544190 [compost metagenome]